MRIIPTDDINLLELDTIAAIIRLVPFEDEYIEAKFLHANETDFQNNHELTP